MIITDSARFHVDDADPLVVASFACPFCLQVPDDSLFNLEEPNGSAVLCHCESCSARWVVALNTGQAMRLAIAPPIGMELQPA